MIGKLFRPLSTLCALLVLYVAIVGRIPTSACHCHEKKQQSSDNKESKKACAFGQARSLAASILLDAPSALPQPIAALFANEVAAELSPSSARTALPFNSRAPPTFLA